MVSYKYFLAFLIFYWFFNLVHPCMDKFVIQCHIPDNKFTKNTRQQDCPRKKNPCGTVGTTLREQTPKALKCIVASIRDVQVLFTQHFHFIWMTLYPSDV